MKAALPANERDRVEALQRYEVLGTAPEDALDDIVAIAAEVTGQPEALVSFVDSDRQWFKARRGVDVEQDRREISFCAHAILHPHEVTVVPDTMLDERFADNPLVTGEPHVRFYAGAPLVTADGLALGTLCVLGHQPASLHHGQVESLRALARQVMRELDRRRAPLMLQAILDRSPALIYVKDLTGRYLLVNKQFEERLNRRAADLLGRTDMELHPRWAAGFMESDRRAIEAGAPIEVEELAPDRDGERTYLSLKFPLVDWAGRAYAVGGISTDITDRALAQREAGLLEAAQMVDILDRVADGFVALDRAWQYTYVNEVAAGMFGRDRDSLLGKHIWTEFPEGVGQPFHLNYERAMREQRPMQFEEYYPPWGRWFENRLYPSPNGLAIFFTDVTARRRNEEARRKLLSHLVNAQEIERSRIAVEIHDDTIQWLAALGLRLDLLEERLSDEDDRQALAEAKAAVRQSMQRLRSLVFDLKPPALERGLAAALKELVRQRRDGWQFELSLTDRLELEPPPEERTVLYRIAVEALTNAARHANASRVELIVESLESGVRLCVSDDGAGFEEAPPRPGHFGLAGMRERAELAGGRLEVTSGAGEGTTVEAWIPVGES